MTTQQQIDQMLIDIKAKTIALNEREPELLAKFQDPEHDSITKLWNLAEVLKDLHNLLDGVTNIAAIPSLIGADDMPLPDEVNEYVGARLSWATKMITATVEALEA